MITSYGAQKALNKRLVHIPKPIELDPNFIQQNKFINDTARYIAVQCSRRAGKTNGLAIRFFKTMQTHPKSTCVYLGLTLDSARDIMWPVLQELNEKHNLGCTFLDSRLTMTHPNGAKLKLLGADMKNFIKRLKGKKHPGIAIDEAQDFGSHLESLVDDVLNACLADYKDGWIALTGTPGPVPKGYFFDITQGRKYDFSYHEWTLLDNPYMPDPKSFIDDLIKRKQWDSNNPTLLREWKNKWVLDLDSLWIHYKDSVNHFDIVPALTGNNKYHYIMGIDLGYKDADALAVIAWHESTPNTYLVEEVITPKQGITELVNQIDVLIKKYDPDKLVMDEGGLGKKIGEEIRRQKQIPVQGADKKLKQQNVEFLNDALRTGKFKAKSASRFAQDSYLVQIDWDKSTPERIVVKKHPHSDIIDAVLYAFKESPAYAFEKPKDKVVPNSKEWFEEERTRMFELEMEGLRKEQERNGQFDGGDWNN